MKMAVSATVVDEVVVGAVNVVVAGVATPPVFTATAVPMLVPPAWNWTVPAGMGRPA